MLELWNWYKSLMDNSIALIIFVTISVIVVNWWGKKEEQWKTNNSFGISKKIIKVIGIALIVIFGGPGIVLFFGSI
jgi:hypothetical protein